MNASGSSYRAYRSWEGQRAHASWIERGENLADTAAAVVADQVDLVDGESIEQFAQHVRIGRDRDVLAGHDLRVAVRQQIRRDAVANVAQLGELVTPQVLVHEHTMDEQRDRARARLVVGDLAGRGLGAADAEHGRLGGHSSVLQALEAGIRPDGAQPLV